METRKDMTNVEIAKLLRAVAAAYQIKHEKTPNARFRIIAYQKAAEAVEHLTSEIQDLWKNDKLDSIPGFGSAMRDHVHELFTAGKVKDFEEVLDGLPPAMFELMQVPGIGAKRAYKLARELGITKAHGAIEKLAKAAKQGKVRGIEGMGEQSELQILQTVEQVKNKSVRFLLPYAQTVADEVIAYMKLNHHVKRIDPLGSLRRQVATIGDVDISVATDHPKEVIAYFVAYPKKTKLIEAGEHSAAILVPGGLHVDLMVQPPQAYGALLQHFTGSKDHNIALRTLMLKKGLSLSEYGIKKKEHIEMFEAEKEFYEALGMDWIPPELREDQGEIQAAIEHKLPHLVTLQDLKGDLHLHSNFPPETSHDAGANSMEEMVAVADELGYEYIAFTEHNLKQDEKLSNVIDVLERKKERVEHINATRGKPHEKRLQKVFNSLEIDIKPSGQLALPESALDLLDFAVVAVHSSFQASREDQTKRVLAALEHPKVKIFAHPTGRMLNSREGIDLDWEKVFACCVQRNIWLEINSWPERLDLPDSLVHEAIQLGVKLVVSTDSHIAEQMHMIRFGVSVARRGWAEKKDVVNTLSLKDFEKEVYNKK